MNTSFTENENSQILHLKPHIKTPAKKRHPLKQFTPLSKLNFPSDLIDKTNDPQFVCEYAPEIFHNLFLDEDSVVLNSDYIKKQPAINYKMRAVLIDWLVSVHLKFKLLTETLFLTVNMIDRYLEKKVIDKAELQLVGVTAMFVASKYEEITPVTVNDFVFITDKTYSKEQMFEVERDMLKTLDYNLTTFSV